MKTRLVKNRTVIVSLLCIPLFVILPIFVLSCLPVSSGLATSWDLNFLFLPYFCAYLFMPSPVGILYLLACLFANLWAWRDRQRGWKSRTLLVLSLVAILLGTGYDIWWYATRVVALRISLLIVPPNRNGPYSLTKEIP